MEGNYEVMLGAKSVGRVQVIREGLYYRFNCRCHIAVEAVHKLVVRCGGVSENIGVLIPVGDGFLLEKRIPVKKFSTGEPEFYLAPRHDTVRGKFVPIYPEEPFAYISRLKDAFLISRNGQAGILLEGNVDQYIDQ